jgi:hypothetical protein
MGMDTSTGYSASHSIPSQIFTNYRMHYFMGTYLKIGQTKPKTIVIFLNILKEDKSKTVSTLETSLFF